MDDQTGGSVEPKRIAIACQGGGSQCAFVAGALKALFAAGIHERYRIVGLSGTSGGAFTAALAWMGLLKHAQGDRTPIEERIMACWNDLTAQTPREIMLDTLCVEMVRAFEGGLLPSMAMSPASLRFKMWSRAMASLIGRPEYTDLRVLLDKHLEFDELPSLVGPDSPVLLAGAADVLDGTFKTFSSALGEIGIEALLASAAVPTLFPAVWVEGHAYWDGIFSSNPPIASFVRKAAMGACPLPNEIWIIRVNPVRCATVPQQPYEISDRRNAMAGNLSLQHELEMLTFANLLIQNNAFTEQFRARVGLEATEPIRVHTIGMSEGLLERLDYPSKLSRNPAHIARLVADGELQAGRFLAELEQLQRAA